MSSAMHLKDQIKIDIVSWIYDNFGVDSSIDCVLFQEWGHERLVRAQQTAELRPYDIEAWSVMLREAQSRHVNEVRSLYESMVTVYPTTARYWKIYIEQEVSKNSLNLKVSWANVYIFADESQELWTSRKVISALSGENP